MRLCGTRRPLRFSFSYLCLSHYKRNAVAAVMPPQEVTADFPGTVALAAIRLLRRAPVPALHRVLSRPAGLHSADHHSDELHLTDLSVDRYPRAASPRGSLIARPACESAPVISGIVVSVSLVVGSAAESI